MSRPPRPWSTRRPPVSSPDRPAAAVLAAGGAYLPPAACYRLWPVLRRELDRHRSSGGTVPPEVTDAMNALRGGYLAYASTTSANGPDQRTSADIDAQSDRDAPVTTAALAGRLGVTDRHVRRLAAAEGIEPLARGLWRREDADHLASTRSPQCPRPPPE